MPNVLRACQSCGSKEDDGDLYLVEDTKSLNLPYAIQCSNCGNVGKYCSSVEKAIESWNE